MKDGEVVADGFTEPDQEVFIGFRPEYLRVSKNGKITAKTDLIEHIGRDTMILCEIEGYDHLIRAIVPNDMELKVGQTIKLDCVKLFVFNAETGERYR